MLPAHAVDVGCGRTETGQACLLECKDGFVPTVAELVCLNGHWTTGECVPEPAAHCTWANDTLWPFAGHSDAWAANETVSVFFESTVFSIHAHFNQDGLVRAVSAFSTQHTALTLLVTHSSASGWTPERFAEAANYSFAVVANGDLLTIELYDVQDCAIAGFKRTLVGTLEASPNELRLELPASWAASTTPGQQSMCTGCGGACHVPPAQVLASDSCVGAPVRPAHALEPRCARITAHGFSCDRLSCEAGYLPLQPAAAFECQNGCFTQPTCVPDLNFALRFSSPSHQVVVRNVLDVPLTSFALCLWLRTTANSGFLFSYAVDAANVTQRLDNALALEVRGQLLALHMRNAVFLLRGTPPNLFDGRWHHVCVAWNGAQAQLFADGVLDTTVAVGFDEGDNHLPAGGSVALGNDQDIEGGGFEPSQQYVGQLSQVQLHAALSPGEIKGLYAAGRPRPLVPGPEVDAARLVLQRCLLCWHIFK